MRLISCVPTSIATCVCVCSLTFHSYWILFSPSFQSMNTASSLDLHTHILDIRILNHQCYLLETSTTFFSYGCLLLAALNLSFSIDQQDRYYSLITPSLAHSLLLVCLVRPGQARVKSSSCAHSTFNAYLLSSAL